MLSVCRTRVLHAFNNVRYIFYIYTAKSSHSPSVAARNIASIFDVILALIALEPIYKGFTL